MSSAVSEDRAKRFTDFEYVLPGPAASPRPKALAAATSRVKGLRTDRLEAGPDCAGTEIPHAEEQPAEGSKRTAVSENVLEAARENQEFKAALTKLANLGEVSDFQGFKIEVLQSLEAHSLLQQYDRQDTHTSEEVLQCLYDLNEAYSHFRTFCVEQSPVQLTSQRWQTAFGQPRSGVQAARSEHKSQVGHFGSSPTFRPNSPSPLSRASASNKLARGLLGMAGAGQPQGESERLPSPALGPPRARSSSRMWRSRSTAFPPAASQEEPAASQEQQQPEQPCLMCGEAAATEGTAATEGLCLECHSETATAVSADPLVSHDANSFSFSAAPKRSHGHGNAAMLAAGLGAVKLKRAKPNPQLNTEYESSHASGSAPHDLFGGGGGSEVTERVAASRKRLIALRRSEADKEERGRAQAEDAVSRRQMQTSAWEQERSQEVDRLRAAAEAQVAQQQAARRLESDVMGHSPAGGVRSSARPYGRSNAPPLAASRALPGPAGRVSRGGGARGPRQGWATFVAGREVSQNKRSPEQKTAAVGSSAADGMLWRRGGWLAMLYHRSLPPFDAAPDGGRLDSCIRQVRGQAAAAAALRTQQVRHGLPQGGPPQKIASLCVMVTECGGQTTGADALLTLSDPTGSMQAIVDGGVLRQLADRQGLHPAAASLSVGVVLRLRQLSGQGRRST